MSRVSHSIRMIAAAAFVTVPLLPLCAQSGPTIAQFMSPPSPQEITAARDADRIAWTNYERGLRNIYTAAAPDFKAVRLTSFLQDNGIVVSDVSLSADGAVAVFVRGSAPNREGWIANPSHDPNGPDRAIWAVRTAGGGAWKLADGSNPALSPDGRFVLYVKDGQIYRARVTRTPPTTKMDRGEEPFIEEWGSNGNPVWSPDGSKVVYVSNRQNHSLLALYDVTRRTVRYLAPSVDFDNDPVWSPDSKEVAFTRRPGLPFGQQTQAGTGSIGNPAGPGAQQGRNPNWACPQSGRGGRGGRGFGRGGFGRFGGAPDTTVPGEIPGLCRATFRGGYTLSVMIANVATGDAREIWHNAPNDTVFTNVRSMMWGGDHLVFPLDPPGDEWDRYWSISVNGPMAEPKLLTTTDGLIENATSVALSHDGKTLYYCTNANDIERRHIWAVPTAGGTPRQISTGDGVETSPTPLSSGSRVAVLYFNAKVPASIGIVPAGGGAPKVVYPTLGKDFPTDAHVVPQIVIVKSPDGLEIHDQLFLPKDLKPGEKRPAMIFVHGGPPRQMLPAYHYMQFYHWAYAFNQWLQSQGYIVLSVNYRSGIGYGNSFRRAPNTGGRGNAEYQDVLAAGKYLQSRPDVDSTRVGIWGLSYGGVLTSQALARNSDVFIAGADLAGVHLWGSSLDTTSTSYLSSTISAIDGWKSPVYLLQGDDDRNVDFAQMIGLVDLLRARNVYYELTVIPDDTHESLIHANWIHTWNAIGDFLKRFVWNRETPPAVSPR